ncbi:hypothetical protein BBFL7_02396 [Flavobacteria bacterium BBFL7]|nr:hypothetical protein BBFL7_02396 [Flavobacteria bacterium BBFL7]
MDKIAIISGRYPSTIFDSVTNHKIYADRHKYHYVHCNWPTGEVNRYFNKIRYILYYFDFFDYIIWLDDDAFFWDLEKDIMDYAPKNDKFLSICKSPNFKSLKTYFSSGQFILKTNNIANEFLNSVLTLEMAIVKQWWNDDLGYFTNGDQDLMTFLSIEDSRFVNGITLHEYEKFNSRIQNLDSQDIHNPLILHFTGTVELKREDYLQVQKKFDLPPSLISHNILSSYNIVTNTNKKSLKDKIVAKLKSWLRG